MTDFNTLGDNAANLGLQAGLTGLFNFPVPGQTFRNIALGNLNPAVYALAIRSPTRPHRMIASYTFPLSPEHLRKEYTAMTTTYDVAGSAAQQGVQRIIDTYGNTPVTFMIEGTTGWQFHGSDGFRQSGLQAIQRLQAFLGYFAYINQLQAQNGLPNQYILEFYDYFSQDFWQIVPVGPQGIRQNRGRPLLFNYSFRFDGVQSVDAPLSLLADAIAIAFASALEPAATKLLGALGGPLVDYAAVTLVTR